MAKLHYLSIGSLDGYIADERGNFDWAEPDEELHVAVNDLERPVGTMLFGRRMYETMQVWDDPAFVEDHPPYVHDFAGIWKAADKVVYSTTLSSAPTARTRIERAFDAAAVRRMKEQSARDLSIGGPELAGHAIAHGLVDECHLFLHPIVIGGGTRALPDGAHTGAELVAVRRLGNGVVHLHYRFRSPSTSP